MSLAPELIERIKQRYGENSRTYKMVVEDQNNETDQLTVTGSMNLRPELDTKK